MQPVEPNPEFENELRAAAGNGGVILYCEAGGTVQPTLNFPIGACCLFSRLLPDCLPLFAEQRPDGMTMAVQPFQRLLQHQKK